MLQYDFLLSADNELNIKTLNDVAVEYFTLGLKDLSYRIWDELYHKIQDDSNACKGLLPVISCNMGNMLRRTGYHEEAYRVLTQGLKGCFGSGNIDAMPELIIQLSILRMQAGHKQTADSMYSFGKHIFCWSRQTEIRLSLEDMMEQDILIHFGENDV
ncbi:MAG: hypothetical protein K2N87_03525 [Eubacterium sp.]|nr:hypothetical protein [Eubacterium sp.]